MRSFRLGQALLAVVLLCLPAGLAAQKARPRAKLLPAGADTNSPIAFYRHALSVLDQDPRKAADALYWATRLDPRWSEALYARRIAELRADQLRMMRYFRGDKRLRQSKEIRALDSLMVRAIAINPFLHRQLDPGLVRHYLRADWEEFLRRRNPGLDVNTLRAEIEREIETYLRMDGGLWMRAWLAYGEGRFTQALDYYARTLDKQHKNPEGHVDRADIFYLQGNFAESVAELTHALMDMQEKDRKEESLWIYFSREVLEYKLGMAYARLEQLDQARAAFDRALAEDLAFYPAHVILSNFALLARDPATAVWELGLAVDLAPQEPGPLLEYGLLQLQTGDVAGADSTLQRLATLEPWFPEPRRVLGDVAERGGRPAEAIGHYRAFLALTYAGDKRVPEVRARLTALGASP